MIRVGGLANGVDDSVAVDMPSAEEVNACRSEAGAAKPAADERVAAREKMMESFIIISICSAFFLLFLTSVDRRERRAKAKVEDVTASVGASSCLESYRLLFDSTTDLAMMFSCLPRVFHESSTSVGESHRPSISMQYPTAVSVSTTNNGNDINTLSQRPKPTMPTRLSGAAKMTAVPYLLSVTLVLATVSTFSTTKKRYQCHAFTSRPSSTSFSTNVATTAAMTKTKTTPTAPFFFAEEIATQQKQQQLSDTDSNVLSALQAQQLPPSPAATTTRRQQLLFDDSTLAEANDALKSVGWGGMPLMNDGDKREEEAALTSDDPFVKRIDASIREETGVGLEELLNPAKVRF